MRLEKKDGYVRHHILPCLKYYSKEYGNDIYEEFDERDCVYLTREEHTKLHHKGKHQSEETKEKLSQPRPGFRNSTTWEKGHIPWNKGLIGANEGYGNDYVCVETGVVIHSTKELQEYLNNPKAQTSTFSKVCGTNKTRYGYH